MNSFPATTPPHQPHKFTPVTLATRKTVNASEVGHLRRRCGPSGSAGQRGRGTGRARRADGGGKVEAPGRHARGAKGAGRGNRPGPFTQAFKVGATINGGRNPPW